MPGYATWDQLVAGEEEARRSAAAEWERRVVVASAANAEIVERFKRDSRRELVAELEAAAAESDVTVDELLAGDGFVTIFGRQVFKERVRRALSEGGAHA